MKRRLLKLLLLPVFVLCAGPSAFAQYGQCTLDIAMVNHNRYAYDTAEECLACPTPPCHSTPTGVWGVSSNVGSKRDADQFKGWTKDCSNLKVDWNSCSREYVKPDLDCHRLNFPDKAGAYPYPANGYPYTDSYGHNNWVPSVGGTHTCVDQYSPCGPNIYGGVYDAVGVTRVLDTDSDGVVDSGGCMDLNGLTVTVSQNFMTVYEMDSPDSDDVINSLYYPNRTVTLNCTPLACFPVGDTNFDGWIEDTWNQFSTAYAQPTLYQDNHDRISYATDPGVLAKRIDATIRVGAVFSRYNGPMPCGDPYMEQECNSYGYPYQWNYNNCTCDCVGSPSLCAEE